MPRARIMERIFLSEIARDIIINEDRNCSRNISTIESLSLSLGVITLYRYIQYNVGKLFRTYVN